MLLILQHKNIIGRQHIPLLERYEGVVLKSKKVKLNIMKTHGRIFIVSLLTVALFGSCAKNDSKHALSLKESITQGAGNLNTAMDAIASSPAYGIFTLNDGGFKSGTTDPVYEVYIPLDKIKGVYDYKPVPKIDRHGRSIIQFFNQTADDSRMIVNMPLSKVVNPRLLRHYSEEDPLLPNNFSIAVSDYHNNYNNYHDYDYALASAISIDGTPAGNLNINSLVSPTEGIHSASQYAFTGSYTAQYKYDSGDPTVSSFSITGDGKILYEEKLITTKSATPGFRREHQYILTIGDVQITRDTETHSVEVSLNGVLQPNATVTIVDKEEDDEASVCKKRDILITFEDGTTTTVSALIGESIGNIKTLFESLHQVYFAAYVVDWIAYDIYYQRN
jgi:hypothetical protein